MTLIEVMLALALFAMLSVFVLSVVNSVLGLWQAGERRGNGDLAFSAASARMRADLAAMHFGPSGWFIMDDWEAWPAEDSQPPWRLPCLRFLARGASLPTDDPTGRAAIEVAWAMVPVDGASSRLSRLVRLAQPVRAGKTFQNDKDFLATLRTGAGVPMVEGVAHLEWNAFTPEGETVVNYRVPSETPFDFPSQVNLSLERVGPEAQQNPLTLDEDISASSQRLVLRGNYPLRTPGFVLIDREWISVQGTFPGLKIVEHGMRNTVVSDHSRGDAAWAPVSFQSQFNLASEGRRVLP
jgi:hypothetical protein